MSNRRTPPETSKLDLIPMFETRGRSNEEIADFLADATRGVVDLSMPHGLEGFILEGRSWCFGDVSVNEGYASGLGYQIDPIQHRRHELVQLNSVCFGEREPTGGTRDRVIALGIGGEFGPTAVAANAIDFVLPFERLGFDPHRDGANTVLDPGDPVGRVLAAAMKDATRCLPHASLADGIHIVDNLCALVRDLLLSNRRHVDRKNLARARRMAIDGYIEENLSADLSAFHLAEAFAVSRTSLFRMFKNEGGVETYVTKRRLRRAFHGLRAIPPGKGAVCRIAERLGFFDAANFNRAFRREFGLPPSDLVGTGPLKTEGLRPH